MVGFWDRYFEQLFFEADFIPFIDTRQFSPTASLNANRYYDKQPRITEGIEPTLYNNPCKYITDFFQGFNWLPEDFPGAPTSADHRRFAYQDAYRRWDAFDDPEFLQGSNRPVHEESHALDFEISRVYNSFRNMRWGPTSEGLVEAMTKYIQTASTDWMCLVRFA